MNKPRKTTGSRYIKNGLIIVLNSIVLLGVIELILRAVYLDELSNLEDWRENLAYQFNEHYLVELKPSISKTFTRKEINGGEIIDWKTNSDGFRGEELDQNSKFRVVVYGDSNVQARFSFLENTFPAKLGKYLENLGIDEVEVINAGVVGFGPDQSLLRFEQEVDTIKPDIVIFHIFADNDYGDLIRNRLFELNEKYKLQRTGFQATVDSHLLYRHGKGYLGIFRSLLIFSKSKSLADWLGKKLSGSSIKPVRLDKRVTIPGLIESAHEQFHVYTEGLERQYSHFYDAYDADIAVEPKSVSSEEKIKLMEAVLLAASRFAATKDVKFVVLIQPAQIDIAPENAKRDWRSEQEAYLDYLPTNLTSPLVNICYENDLNCIDLFNEYSTNDPKSLYFMGDNNHWNDEGQEFAASVTGNYLVNRFPKLFEKL